MGVLSSFTNNEEEVLITTPAFLKLRSTELPQNASLNSKHDVHHNKREFYRWLLTCIAYSLLERTDFTSID